MKKRRSRGRKDTIGGGRKGRRRSAEGESLLLFIVFIVVLVEYKIKNKIRSGRRKAGRSLRTFLMKFSWKSDDYKKNKID